MDISKRPLAKVLHEIVASLQINVKPVKVTTMKKSMRTFFVTLAALCVCCCTVSFLTACNDDDDAPKVNGKIGTLRVDINIKEVYKQMD